MDALSIYGAVVATIVAGWNIYRETTDRGRLRVTLGFGDLVQGGSTIGSERLWVSVTNIGRKAVYLDRIGGRFKRGNQRTHFLIVTAQTLPTKLEPGATFTDVSADAERFDASRLRYFAAWDSLGRVYKAPRRQLRDLQRNK